MRKILFFSVVFSLFVIFGVATAEEMARFRQRGDVVNVVKKDNPNLIVSFGLFKGIEDDFIKIICTDGKSKYFSTKVYEVAERQIMRRK